MSTFKDFIKFRYLILQHQQFVDQWKILSMKHLDRRQVPTELTFMDCEI